MKKIFFLTISLLFSNLYCISQNDMISIGGVKFYNELVENRERLVLNGVGIREKFFIDLYVCGLYLDKKNTDDKFIINSNTTMLISVRIISSKVSREVFINAVNEGFKKSNYGKASKEQIYKFANLFKDAFKIGDKIQLVYLPDKGIIVEKNGVELGVIQGLEFKKALFCIWLGKNPADETLKTKLLGR